MKIVFLLPGNVIGGGVFVVYEHAKRLAAAGHDLTIAFADPQAKLTIDVYDGMSAVAVRHLHEVGEERFDIAVATAWQTAYQVVAIRARTYLYLVQDDERRFYSPPHSRVDRWLARQTYRDDFVYLVTAPWLGEMLRSEFGQKSTLVPVAIDVKRFVGATPTVPRGTKLRVLVEGRGSEPRKQIPLTFEVLRGVDGVEVFYASADGYTEPGWRCDRLFSRVPHAQMPGIYASCDLLLKLSSQESFGLPVLETFAGGGTAVVSAYTGHEWFVRDGDNALVVPIGDKSAAIAAVVRLRDDPDLLASLKQGASRSFGNFDWAVSADTMRATLGELAENPPPQRLARMRGLSFVFRYRDVPAKLRRAVAARLGGGGGGGGGGGDNA